MTVGTKTFDTDALDGLQGCIWRHDMEPSNATPLATWAGRVNLYRGGLLVFSGKAKSAKSALSQAMVSASLGGSGDFLGWSPIHTQGDAVVTVDFEQSRDDWILQTRRLFGRARMRYADPPPWLYSVHLRKHDIAERWKKLEAVLDMATDQCGGVALLVLDGIADLMANVNDIEESSGVIRKLMTLSEDRNCLVAGIVHTNEGQQSGDKVRGHLGSDLQRKVENVIVLEKSADGVTEAYTTVHRGAGVTRALAVRFGWSDADRMHVTLADKATERQAELYSDVLPLIKDIVDRPEGGRYCDIVQRLMTRMHVENRKAKHVLKELRTWEILKQDVDRGPYRLAN